SRLPSRRPAGRPKNPSSRSVRTEIVREASRKGAPAMNRRKPWAIGLFLSFVAAGCNPSGTTLGVNKTLNGHHQRTFAWTIGKSVSPDVVNLFSGETGSTDFTIAVTKDVGTDSFFIDGQICITNQGGVATETLAITHNVQHLVGVVFQTLTETAQDVSEHPVLA